MQFSEISNNLNHHLDKLVSELNDSQYVNIEDIPNINGIYVWYENERPIYVGRTNRNRMKKRLQEHCRKSSNQNSATFAFRLAKELKGNLKLEKIDTYDQDFVKAKERVSNMQIKYLKIDDPIIQTIFEPYFSYKFNTKYNEFMTY